MAFSYDTVFYGVIILIAVIIILLLIRLVLPKKKSMYSALFQDALKMETNGRYKEALELYEQAIEEGERHQDESEQRRIREKIKILKLTMDYENEFHKDSPADDVPPEPTEK